MFRAYVHLLRGPVINVDPHPISSCSMAGHFRDRNWRRGRVIWGNIPWLEYEPSAKTEINHEQSNMADGNSPFIDVLLPIYKPP